MTKVPDNDRCRDGVCGRRSWLTKSPPICQGGDVEHPVSGNGCPELEYQGEGLHRRIEAWPSDGTDLDALASVASAATGSTTREGNARRGSVACSRTAGWESGRD